MSPDEEIIEIVEDDMGEGYKDEVPPELLDKLSDAENRLRKAMKKSGFNHR